MITLTYYICNKNIIRDKQLFLLYGYNEGMLIVIDSSGVGVFFLRQNARLLHAWPSSGNSLTICRLPVTKATVPRTNTIV
jgi:hypothetical protein